MSSSRATARNFPHNTCGASRLVQMAGEALIRGERFAMIDDDPVHLGESMLDVVEELYRVRTAGLERASMEGSDG